jgi:hypothetical protein
MHYDAQVYNYTLVTKALSMSQGSSEDQRGLLNA